MNKNEHNILAIQVEEVLKKQPILLFDGECGFCNKSVSFFLRRENPLKKAVHFAPIESEIGKHLRKYFEIDEKMDGIILIKNHEAFIKSCAALRMTRYMRGLWPALMIFLLIPPFLRNPIYDLVAKQRQRIVGRVQSCELLKDEDQERFLFF
ncbi:MAG: DCC1-like thiol-disulfide oxidoreductase family protein [bacterium]|nr:DCC1-like thiol-disulfide oxidoreductase family protein [bacterium]